MADRTGKDGLSSERAKLAEEKPSEGTQRDEKTTLSWAGKRKLETVAFSPKNARGTSGITIKLAPGLKKKKVEPAIQKKAGSVAAVFGDDESDEEEEMPPEAKMRMRNIGRETPTSAGPNSFNKGKKGFTHHRKVFEKELKEHKP